MILDIFKRRTAQSEFEALFSPHLNSLYGIACGWTSDPQGAEDLVQELAVKVFQRLDEMRTIEKLHPWLVTIMYRMFVDDFRRHKNSPLMLVGDEQLQALVNHPDQGIEFHDEVDAKQLKTLLKVALGRLDPDLRATLILFELEGFSLKEVADIQGLEVGTVKSRLHRAKEKLKNSLDWEPFAGESRLN